MTPEEFTAEYERLKSAGAIRSKADLARRLGLSPNTVARMVKEGCDRRRSV